MHHLTTKRVRSFLPASLLIFALGCSGEEGPGEPANVATGGTVSTSTGGTAPGTSSGGGDPSVSSGGSEPTPGSGGTDPATGGAGGDPQGTGGAEPTTQPNDAPIAGLNNPVFRHIYSADPGVLVHDGRLYIYVGRDEGSTGFVMNSWHVLSTDDMANWTDHGPVLTPSMFSWAANSAWAGHVVERNGKFYWYITAEHKNQGGKGGKAIGVAVGDSPIGPFVDALGSAIITNNMTTNVNSTWDDIDPAVFVDDDGQAYLYWGNTSCKVIRLADDMIHTEGDIKYLNELQAFTEAPYMNKVGGTYFLSFATGWPEQISYRTSNSPLGPFVGQKVINKALPSQTNHQALVEFKGKWYFIYHDAGLRGGGEFRRSVNVDVVNIHGDVIDPIVPTNAGITQIGPGPVDKDFTYKIISRLSAKALSLSSSSGGASIVQKATAEDGFQEWQIKAVGSGTYEIINPETGLCLGPQANNLDAQANMVASTCSGNTAQYFRLLGTADGNYAIVNFAGGKVLDVLDLSTEDNAQIIQYDYLYAENQQWSLVVQ